VDYSIFWKYFMDRLASMSVFLAVVDAGSLSAAGRQLGMPLATVSRKVSELESHLGARLLNRSTRRLTLTDAGRTYREACKRIMEDVNEAERTASGEFTAPMGELVVTAPIVFGRLHVLPIAVEFLATYPDVDVRLVLGDRVVNLLDDHLDVAVRIGELPDSSLIALRVGTIRRVVCASPGYLAAHRAPQQPAELASHQCITFDALVTSTAWDFRIEGVNVAIPVRSRLTVNTAEAAVDAAIAGAGVTHVFSYQVEDAKRARALSVLLRRFEPAPFPVSLVYSKQRRLPLKLRAFLDFATPRLRKRLARFESKTP
jgi:DNA-binding transcriptional LysR family regulator